ncbi:SDR family NAD(P)-dependent oxidoreductase [Frondihabitans australicus]|uniref:NAD(P)-dependent dehydrogenase (Short-subunit alcohol dehydrogenase family) n=1 Tax=Frondihabitans australicus TaxID=386892 RepID=A0A495IC46_9MICO|nr:SDR family NAD(P)-dependent oxidoreductase [Frondihabitans australicus]RKR73573.1 NAD(P)-dependent dehydrogenase (short-subunit alcohol dehydrogenase family) [Frondihabitans australicus]
MSATRHDLAGRTIVITGGSSGIGLAAARALHARGAEVVPIGRTPERVAAVAAELGARALVADFARLDDVRETAEVLLREHERIDVLVHNAGTVVQKRITTVDGHEISWQTNYLAPFLLQSLLAGRLVESRAHVVVTCSVAHFFGRIDLADPGSFDRPFTIRESYGNSKLALLLFAREIARRASTDGVAGQGGASGQRGSVTASAFHPGFVKTNIITEQRGLGPAWVSAIAERVLNVTSPEVGAAALVHLAGAPDPAANNGRYFTPTVRAGAPSSRASRDATLGRALWTHTERALQPHLVRAV